MTTSNRSSHTFSENQTSLKIEKLVSENRNQLKINLYGEGVTPFFGVAENENGELSKKFTFSVHEVSPLLATGLSYDYDEIDTNGKICNRKVRGMKKR